MIRATFLMAFAVSACAQTNLDVRSKYGWIRFSETKVDKSPIGSNMVLSGKVKNAGLWYVESVGVKLSCPDGLTQELSFLYLWDGQEKAFRLATPAKTPNPLTDCSTTLGNIRASNALEKARDVVQKAMTGREFGDAVENLIAGNPKLFRIAIRSLGEEKWLTKAKYDQLTTGMTYTQAIVIAGSEGEETSRSEIGGNSAVLYTWKNSDGSAISAMFSNGKLVSKTQFGLK